MKKFRDSLRGDIEKLLGTDAFKVPPPIVTNASFVNNATIANKSRLSRSNIVDTLAGKPYRFVTKRRVRHQILDRHLSIAWDLDRTLLNGEQSWFWRRWIRDNHRVHKFWIVTFRAPNDANRIWSDLSECSDPLSSDWFDGVRVVEPVLWQAWAHLPEIIQDFDHESKLTPEIQNLVDREALDVELIISINRAIRAWKAVECLKLKCSLLVEDRESFCKPYCDALGVQFLNAVTG